MGCSGSFEKAFVSRFPVTNQVPLYLCFWVLVCHSYVSWQSECLLAFVCLIFCVFLIDCFLFVRYLVWVRRANRQISIIRAEFNQKEYELRAHSDYENVLESDIEAMSLFRKAGNLGAYVVEDDTTVGGHSMAASSRASSRTGSIFRRRQSQGGHSAGASVSSVPSKVSTNRSDLSPLPEEKDGETEDDYPEVDTGSPGGNSSLGSSSRMFSPESRGGLSTQGSYEQKV